MSTTHSSFDQYCISHKTISHKAAAVPSPEVHRECPWHNFLLCPSSQQILATPLPFIVVRIFTKCRIIQTCLSQCWLQEARSVTCATRVTQQWSEVVVQCSTSRQSDRSGVSQARSASRRPHASSTVRNFHTHRVCVCLCAKNRLSSPSGGIVCGRSSPHPGHHPPRGGGDVQEGLSGGVRGKCPLNFGSQPPPDPDLYPGSRNFWRIL